MPHKVIIYDGKTNTNISKYIARWLTHLTVWLECWVFDWRWTIYSIMTSVGYFWAEKSGVAEEDI